MSVSSHFAPSNYSSKSSSPQHSFNSPSNTSYSPASSSYSSPPNSSYSPPSQSYLQETPYPSEFSSNFNQTGLSPEIIQGAQYFVYGNSLLSNAAKTASSWQSFINLQGLRYYFNVNNSYVKNKLLLLLFPIRNKYWYRKVVRSESDLGYLPPRDDLNAPDLYIPVMSFITYIILVGFLLGTADSFTPEVLGLTFSKGFILICLEVFLLKASFYFLEAPVSAPVLDLFAWSGYIYVGVILNTLTGLFFGPYLFYVSNIFTSFNMAVFMVKTIRLLLLPDSSGSVGGNAPPPPLSMSQQSGNQMVRNYFLVSLAILQMIFVYFLSVQIEFNANQ